MIRLRPLGLVAVLVLAGPAAAQQCANVKLNQPVPEDGVIVGYGTIPDDSGRVAFLGDLETDNLFDLFTVPVTGGAEPIRFDLDTPRAQGLTGFPIFTPDGTRAVFRGDFDTEGTRELYSIETTSGGGTPVKLNGPLTGDVQREFLVTPDGTSVVYLAEEESNREELYIVPILGGTSRRLNGDLMSGDVEDDFRLSPDGRFVVYRAEQDTLFRNELYAVELAGGDPVRLNGTLQPLGSVSEFVISPDGSTVLYIADQDVDNRRELFQVPIGGGTATRVSGAEVEREVEGAIVSPDSRFAVYFNERFVEGSFGVDLYSAALAGGDPVRLNDPLPMGGTLITLTVSPDSARVVFEGSAETAQLREIFSVPIDGGPVTKLSGDLSAADGTTGFGLSPDGATVVFGVDRDPGTGATVVELVAVPIAGGPVQSLAGPFPPDRLPRQLDFAPTGDALVYSVDLAAEDRFEIFQVPLDAAHAPRRLNRPLADGASVGAFANPDFQFSEDGRFAIFLADQETIGVTELWSADLACEEIFADGFEGDDAGGEARR